MTAAPWTPGPWVADVVRGWGSDPVVSSASWPKPIAQMIPHGDRYYRHNRRNIRGETITTFGPETPEGEARKREVDAQLVANAHLIAAAPDLYFGGEAQTDIIRHAQAILTQYLIPDGIDGPEAINQLLGLLDGPEQRAAQAAWDAALAKARGQA